MDIKDQILKNVNQLVDSHISSFESKYIPFLIGNEVIKIHVKLDVEIDSIEYETDSVLPIIVDLVDELNSGGLKRIPYGLFYGSKSNPMLQIDDRYFLCMIGMPHQVTRAEYNESIVPIAKNVHNLELCDGDWVMLNNDFEVSSFALVYRDRLYFWNFSQVESEPVQNKSYTKLIFQ